MNTIGKTIFYNILLFIGIYAVTSLTEWELNVNKWSNLGVIFFVVVFCIWSIIITITQALKDERE